MQFNQPEIQTVRHGLGERVGVGRENGACWGGGQGWGGWGGRGELNWRLPNSELPIPGSLVSVTTNRVPPLSSLA